MTQLPIALLSSPLFLGGTFNRSADMRQSYSWTLSISNVGMRANRVTTYTFREENL